MLLLFFPIVYSPPAETAYLSSEPWAKEVKFVGWDYVRYNYYLYRNIMLGYPWVVRMAYTIVFFCCVATFLLFIAMAWDVYRRRKLDRKNERLRKRYYDKIMELARMDLCPYPKSSLPLNIKSGIGLSRNIGCGLIC